MQKQTYYVKGMHCVSCEVLIEKELLTFSGVISVDVSLSKGLVNIEYQQKKLSVSDLNERFEKYGYQFSESLLEKEKDNGVFGVVVISMVIIVLFLIISNLGLASLINISSESSWLSFFIFGLLAGVSSCAALIGGLVLSLSKRFVMPGGFIEKSRPYLLLNLGRLLSYSLLGLLLGFLGEKFQISPIINLILVLLVSGIMLILAMQMIGVKVFNKFGFILSKSFSTILVKNSQTKTMSSFVIGFITFLLPCGFTMVAEGLAMLSGNPWRGLMIMFSFVLGTVVPLFLIGFSSAKFVSNKKFSKKFLKIAGILVIFFVVYNVNFQFGISRFVLEKFGYTSQVDTGKSKTSEFNMNIQKIKAVYTGVSDIQPNIIEVKVGKPVIFEIVVQDDVYGCMSTVMIPRLWSKPLDLKKGKILVMEFTPQEIGDYQITCAMGVPRGMIKVVN